MRTRWRALAVAAVVVTAVAVSIVVRNQDESAPSGSSDAPEFGRAHAGLCDALRAALDGDTAQAQGVFLARSHQSLHTLASEVSDTDRAAAARLLEAKAAVESSLPIGSAAAASDLRRLAARTSDAIAALDQPRPDPCP